MQSSPVVHFEMPYEDRQRMADFYTKAFGWKPQMLGSEMGEYVMMQTSETGKDGFPTQPGRINGGFYKRTENAKYPSVVIDVRDIKQAMKQVIEAGGKLVENEGAPAGEPIDIPGIGLYVAFDDTEGNRVGMLQSTNGMGPK